MRDVNENVVALSVDGLTRRFGGLVAVDNVSFDLPGRRLNAIIGPNGAGKTTLFNLITGEIRPDMGRVQVHGQDITNLKPHEIVRHGVSRTLQIKSVFSGLTVGENVRTAVMAHERLVSPFRSAASYSAVNSRVDSIVAQVGLTPHMHTLASALSYGDVALLEIALALANEPRLLLLDEPVCGMGPQETEQAVSKIREIARSVDVILIEHDMEVVFAVADEIIVMAQGAILARGTPTEISNSPEVQEAYLGAPEEAEG